MDMTALNSQHHLFTLSGGVIVLFRDHCLHGINTDARGQTAHPFVTALRSIGILDCAAVSFIVHQRHSGRSNHCRTTSIIQLLHGIAPCNHRRSPANLKCLCLIKNHFCSHNGNRRLPGVNMIAVFNIIVLRVQRLTVHSDRNVRCLRLSVVNQPLRALQDDI